ncbi:hypothetical protein DFP78_11377 [Photobacterium lutimaris]|nr:hypothetical protein DFP78_11377 [Photobacterium lutimaris]
MHNYKDEQTSALVASVAMSVSLFFIYVAFSAI